MLILVNVIVFLLVWLSEAGLLRADIANNIVENFAMRPYFVAQGEQLHTLFTSMFLHEGFFHIFGNMLFLYIFGDNIEDIFGHAGYFFFYTICGLAAGYAQVLSMTSLSPDQIVLGASGAISGVLGAYFVLFPKSTVSTIILVGFPIMVPLPTVVFLGIWFALQWVYGVFDLSGGVAYWAHIGGFIAGIVLGVAFGMKRKKAKAARYRL